jgi:hypothetical protein
MAIIPCFAIDTISIYPMKRKGEKRREEVLAKFAKKYRRVSQSFGKK